MFGWDRKTYVILRSSPQAKLLLYGGPDTSTQGKKANDPQHDRGELQT